MTICRVASCDRPVGDAWCCSHCARDLEIALGDIPAVMHQLDLTLAKAGRFGAQSERVGADTPLPLDLAASNATHKLRAALVSWVLLVAEERGQPLPANTLNAMSAWMLHHIEWLRHHKTGHEAIEQITSAMDTARKVIDVPANRTKFEVGPCPELQIEQTTAVSTTNLSTTATTDAPRFTRATWHCFGEVWAYIPNDEHQPARLECNTCHTIWHSWQWIRLGKRIIDRAKGSAA